MPWLMIEQFARRNLTRTMEFLSKIGYCRMDEPIIETHTTVREQLAMAYQNAGNYRRAYTVLLCPQSGRHPRMPVFCGCCGSTVNFLRNWSLLELLWKEAGPESPEEGEVVTDGYAGTGGYSKIGGRAGMDVSHCGDEWRMEKGVVVYKESRADAFSTALRAYYTKDIAMLVEALETVPLFWDGFLMLGKLIDRFVPVSGPLAGYFYMFLKVERGIDPPGYKIDGTSNRPFSMDSLPYKIEIVDPNLLAAFLFCCGDIKKSIRLFDQIYTLSVDNPNIIDKIRLFTDNNRKDAGYTAGTATAIPSHDSVSNTELLTALFGGADSDHREYRMEGTEVKTTIEVLEGITSQDGNIMERVPPCIMDSSILNGPLLQTSHRMDGAKSNDSQGRHRPHPRLSTDFRYADIAAQALYSAGDPRLGYLAELIRHGLGSCPLTYTVNGIHNASIGKFSQAKRLFSKAIRLAPTPDLHCMLAYAHARLKEEKEASDHFTRALQDNPNNYRIVYAVAHGFFILGMTDLSLHFARKALIIQDDGAIWKLTGRLHMQSADYRRAIYSFEKAIRLSEYDALLYFAELCNQLSVPKQAVIFYEEYMRVGETNRGTVARFLTDYFDEIGDLDKASLYRALC